MNSTNKQTANNHNGTPSSTGQSHSAPSQVPHAKGKGKVEIDLVAPVTRKLRSQPKFRFTPKLRIDVMVFDFHALRRDLTGFMTQDEIRASIKETLEDYQHRLRGARFDPKSTSREASADPIEDIVFNLHALRPDFSGLMTQAEICAAIKEALLNAVWS